MAFGRVLQALLWSFHNSPLLSRLRAHCRAGTMRPQTVAEALKALEWAGVLSWQHRITRIQERCRDLFGHEGWRWRVIRTSNAYVFHDPLQALQGLPASKSETPAGTGNQDVFDLVSAPAHDPESPLERALARFGTALGGKD